MHMQLNGKVFKVVINPVMMYCPECWAVEKKDLGKLNSTDKMVTK